MPLPNQQVPMGIWEQHHRDKQVYFTATDIHFLHELLPQYAMKNNPVYGMNCVSKTGISDAKDEWLPVFQAIKKHFGSRFLEVNHTVCSDHLNFTIYLKK
jgi:hypothetical protein